MRSYAMRSCWISMVEGVNYGMVQQLGEVERDELEEVEEEKGSVV